MCKGIQHKLSSIRKTGFKWWYLRFFYNKIFILCTYTCAKGSPPYSLSICFETRFFFCELLGVPGDPAGYPGEPDPLVLEWNCVMVVTLLSSPSVITWNKKILWVTFQKYELRFFLNKPIDRHNFKLNSWSPGAGSFSIRTHILLR